MWKIRYYDDSSHRWFTGMTATTRRRADEICGWLQEIGWDAKVEAAEPAGVPAPVAADGMGAFPSGLSGMPLGGAAN